MRLKSLKSRSALNTALGVTFAIIAGVLLLGSLTNIIKGSTGGAPVPVPVAAGDLPAGTVVTPRMIVHRKVPAGYVLPGTACRDGDVKGARLLVGLRKGELFARAALEGGDNIASRIPADLRAYSLSLARGNRAGPDLHGGDTVDVLATTGEPPRTGTLLTARKVLSTSAGGAPDQQGGELAAIQVTLLVTPREAELLAQAECEGEVSLSLCPLPGR